MATPLCGTSLIRAELLQWRHRRTVKRRARTAEVAIATRACLHLPTGEALLKYEGPGEYTIVWEDGSTCAPSPAPLLNRHLVLSDQAPHGFGPGLILDRDFADHRSRRNGIVKSKYEDWLSWIVLSLCGSLFLLGLIRGA
jgi:hypothetical protein